MESTKELIIQKGKGRNTYYLPYLAKNEREIKNASEPLKVASIQTKPIDNETLGFGTPVSEDLSAPVDQSLVHQLPVEIQRIVYDLLTRSSDPSLIEDAILVICEFKPHKSSDLSAILGKTEKYLLRNFIIPLRESGDLEYTYPEMPNHPQQGYKTVKNDRSA